MTHYTFPKWYKFISLPVLNNMSVFMNYYNLNEEAKEWKWLPKRTKILLELSSCETDMSSRSFSYPMQINGTSNPLTVFFFKLLLFKCFSMHWKYHSILWNMGKVGEAVEYTYFYGVILQKRDSVGASIREIFPSFSVYRCFCVFAMCTCVFMQVVHTQTHTQEVD